MLHLKQSFYAVFNIFSTNLRAAQDLLFILESDRQDKPYSWGVYGVVPENTNFGVKVSAVKNLMEGNGIRFKSPNTKAVSKQELSRNAPMVQAI